MLVYVHGFNTSFEEARLRAAQIAYDSGFGGVTILFTWPSQSQLLGYVSDKDSATASRDALQDLLTTVSETPGVGKIHVLAHSMGGWLAMEALRQEAIAGKRTLDGHLGEVMLASPDIDMEVFAAQMAKLKPANVTVFATNKDRALSLSSAIAESRVRIGAIDPDNAADRAKIEALGAKVYDLNDFSDGFIDHGAYAVTPQVLARDRRGAWRRRARKTPTRFRSSTRAAMRKNRQTDLALCARPRAAPHSGEKPSVREMQAVTSKLEALRDMSIVVADTGDMESIKTFKPTDSTTNPTLILKAAQLPAYHHLVDEAVAWGAKKGAPANAVTDRLAVNFGAELTHIVPGRVSTEVDADLSFDTRGDDRQGEGADRGLREPRHRARAHPHQGRRDLGRRAGRARCCSARASTAI